MFGRIKTKNGITKGCIVHVINAKHCYEKYTKFIIYHPQYMLYWAYHCAPKYGIRYKVLGIYSHVQLDKYDTSEYCVVIQNMSNKQIFLIGENGLTLAHNKLQ